MAGKENWNIYKQVERKNLLTNTGKVLDVGCGLGNILWDFNELYGIDINKEYIKEANRKGKYKEVKQGSIYNIPHPDKFFEDVICIEVFQYLEYPFEAFKELMRVSKNKIVVSSPNLNCIGLRSLLFKKYRSDFFKTINKTRFPTNKELYETIAYKANMSLSIDYISSRYGFLRNWLGDILSSEVIGVFEEKWRN